MTNIDTARDDLAYLRGLVDNSGRFQAVAGKVFVWAGALYGVQCLGQGLNAMGAIKLPVNAQLALAFVPTIVLILAMTVIFVRERKANGGKTERGAGARALNAVFQGAGIANLILAGVFAYGASLMQSAQVWLYHPTVICMFQGVAWYVAWAIRRQAWTGAVALGWFASTIACGLLITQPVYFLLTLGVALIAFMAIPGYLMIRTSKSQG
jgi:hypothetical protein